MGNYDYGCTKTLLTTIVLMLQCFQTESFPTHAIQVRSIRCNKLENLRIQRSQSNWLYVKWTRTPGCNSTVFLTYELVRREACPHEVLAFQASHTSEMQADVYNYLELFESYATYNITVRVGQRTGAAYCESLVVTDKSSPGIIDRNSIATAGSRNVRWDPLPCIDTKGIFLQYRLRLHMSQPETVLQEVTIQDQKNTTAYLHAVQLCIYHRVSIRSETDIDNSHWSSAWLTWESTRVLSLSANATSSTTAIVRWTMERMTPSCSNNYYYMLSYTVSRNEYCPHTRIGHIQPRNLGHSILPADDVVLTSLTDLEAFATYDITIALFKNGVSFDTRRTAMTTFQNKDVSVTATNVTLSLSWLLASGCPGLYRVRHTLLRHNACSNVSVSDLPGTFTSERFYETNLTLKDLVPFTTYNITITKTYRRKEIAHASTISATESSVPQWTNFTWNLTGNQLSWTPIACKDIGGQFSSYEVDVIEEDELFTNFTVHDRENTTLTLFGISPCIDYTFHIKVLTVQGGLDQKSGNLRWNEVRVLSMSLEPTSPTSVSVTWKLTSGADRCSDYRYSITYRIIQRESCPCIPASEQDEHTITFRPSDPWSTDLNDLEAHTKYNVSIVITSQENDVTFYHVSSEVITTDKPDERADVVDASRDELLVEWYLAPSCPGRFTVTQEFISRLACQSSAETLTKKQRKSREVENSNSATLSSLKIFALYNITVEKMYNNRVFATISMIASTTAGAPSGPPVVVTARAGKENILFQWRKPECHLRNGPITHFNYILSKDSVPVIRGKVNSSVEHLTTIDIQGLQPYCAYKFKVRAWNEDFYGNYSSPVFIKTKEAEIGHEVDTHTTVFPVATPNHITSASLAGCSTAMVMLGVICFILIIYRRRKQKPSKHTSEKSTGNSRGQTSSMEFAMDEVNSDEERQLAGFVATSANGRNDDGDNDNRLNCDENNEEALIYENVQPDELRRPAIATDRLAEYMTEINSKGVMGFQEEFEMLQLQMPYPSNVASKKENQKKNRYLNVLPYDHSRVKLNLRGRDPNSDYINASFIHGYDTPKKYIAAQGPTSASITDFWRMVWQYDCKKAIMLTNLEEGKKRKCEQYWPDESCSYGDIYVAAQDKHVTKNYTIRRFDVDMAGEHRVVVQYHYTAWPDMGVPEQPSQLMHFIEVTRDMEEANKSPIVVHCSAGFGRTGTFITLDAMLDQMNAEGAVDVFNFVAGMRQHRAKMVQVVEQYQFIYASLLEALTCGDTAIPKVDFMRRYRALKTPNPDTGITSLQEEFELLRSYTVIPGENEVTAAKREENVRKNRYQNKVPPDRVRPYLMTEIEGGTNYINATFFPDGKTRNKYITTQSPLPDTVVDFWRLVVDYKVTRIMMLHGVSQDETFAKYWPEDGELICGPFAVTSNKEVVVPGIVERTLTVRKQTSKKQLQTVYQLQLACNPMENDGPPSASDMIFMRNRLKSWPTHGHDSSPIVVHCRDGVGTSATFCALLSILDRADCSEDVEIFQVCKKLRGVRPEAISHMEQYQLLYDVLQEYISTFEIYENCRG